MTTLNMLRMFRWGEIETKARLPCLAVQLGQTERVGIKGHQKNSGTETKLSFSNVNTEPSLYSISAFRQSLQVVVLQSCTSQLHELTCLSFRQFGLYRRVKVCQQSSLQFQILDTFLQTTYLSCQRSGVHDSKVFHLAAMLTMLNATLARQLTQLSFSNCHVGTVLRLSATQTPTA